MKTAQTSVKGPGQASTTPHPAAAGSPTRFRGSKREIPSRRILPMNCSSPESFRGSYGSSPPMRDPVFVEVYHSGSSVSLSDPRISAVKISHHRGTKSAEEHEKRLPVNRRPGAPTFLSALGLRIPRPRRRMESLLPAEGAKPAASRRSHPVQGVKARSFVPGNLSLNLQWWYRSHCECRIPSPVRPRCVAAVGQGEYAGDSFTTAPHPCPSCESVVEP